MRHQPLAYVSDNDWVDMLRRFVVGRCGWTGTGEEMMVVAIVDPDCNIGTVTEPDLPPREIVVDRQLIVAATLEDEHWFFQCRGRRRRIVAPQVAPIRSR